MNTIQIIEIIIGSIIGIGVLIAGAGYGYAQFFQGKKKLAKDDVELFNEQLEAFKKIIDNQKGEFATYQIKRDAEMQVLRDDIKKHTQEIGRLQGINEEKEKKIKELTDLLSNRDPALGEYIKFARDSIKIFQDQMTEIAPIIKEMKGFMERKRDKGSSSNSSVV